MHQTHAHGLRADPLCDGEQDQRKAADMSAEVRRTLIKCELRSTPVVG